MRLAKKDVTPVLQFLKIVRYKMRRGWTSRVFAADENNHEVQIEDNDAVKFCLMGGIRRTELEICSGNRTRQFPEIKSPTLLTERVIDLIRERLRVDGFTQFITAFNDEKGKVAVLHELDIAIEKLERRLAR